MLSLQSYQNKLSLDGLINETADDLLYFKKESLFARKPFEKLQNYIGASNIVIGRDAAFSLKNGYANLVLGHSAGYNTNNSSLKTNKYSSQNVFLGAEAGYSNTDGYLNTYIGYQNSKTVINNRLDKNTSEFDLRRNIGIGAKSIVQGGSTIGIGNDTINIGKYASVIGHQSSNDSINSLVVGHNIINTGKNSFILRANGLHNLDELQSFSNLKDNYFNLNDIFVGIIGEGIEIRQPIKFTDTVNFGQDIVCNNLTVLDQFISQSNATFELVTINNDVNTYKNVTFSGSNNEFLVHGESRFLGPSIFNNNFNVSGVMNIISRSDFANNIEKHVSFFNDNLVIYDDHIDFNAPTFFKEEVIFETDVTHETKLNLTKGLSSSNLTQIDGPFFINGINFYDIISGSNVELMISDMIPWLHENQNEVELGDFKNEEFAPWIRFDQSNVSLSNFNNDIAPWLQIDPSSISLSIFNDDIIPEWVLVSQSNVELGNFKNDTYKWLKPNQGDVTIGAFGFDEYLLWLKKENHASQKKINISGFTYDGQYRWLNDVGHISQKNHILSGFTNDLAPWLQADQSEISIFGFDTPSWFLPNQDNIRLKGFYNDLAPWLTYYSKDILISIFTHDYLDVQSNSYFNSNVYFRDDTHFTGDSIHVYSSNVLFYESPIFKKEILVKGTATFSSNVDVFGTLDVYDEFTVDINNKEIFKVDEFNIYLNGALKIQGITTFYNDVFMKKNLYIDGLLEVDSNVLFNNTLDVVGDSVFHSNLAINENLHVIGSLEVDSNVLFNNTLDVIGDSVFHSNLAINENLHVIGSLEVDSNDLFNNTLDVV
jgi:hypothetical protein